MALGAGFALARATDRPWPWPAFRQLLIAVVAAGFTFMVGRLVGVGAAAVSG
jgi:VIT1/CCC1 family predicted Fe2+/Mn2+ transporter